MYTPTHTPLVRRENLRDTPYSLEEAVEAVFHYVKSRFTFAGSPFPVMSSVGLGGRSLIRQSNYKAKELLVACMPSLITALDLVSQQDCNTYTENEYQSTLQALFHISTIPLERHC